MRVTGTAATLSLVTPSSTCPSASAGDTFFPFGAPGTSEDTLLPVAQENFGQVSWVYVNIFVNRKKKDVSSKTF